MVAFVDFLISFAILVALMIWYQFMLGWQILLLPLFAAIAFGSENELYLPGLWLSLAVTGFFVWFGIRQFRKMEKSFADLI
jgi:hypothetical protein